METGQSWLHSLGTRSSLTHSPVQHFAQCSPLLCVIQALAQGRVCPSHQGQPKIQHVLGWCEQLNQPPLVGWCSLGQPWCRAACVLCLGLCFQPLCPGRAGLAFGSCFGASTSPQLLEAPGCCCVPAASLLVPLLWGGALALLWELLGLTYTEREGKKMEGFLFFLFSHFFLFCWLTEYRAKH